MGSLSGGEKVKLRLLRLLAEQPDAELLLTYNLSWMAKDTNLIKLKTAAVR